MKKLLWSLSILVGVLGAGTAYAGSKFAIPVVVFSDGVTNYAYGALGSARNSPDNFQSIGCNVDAFPGGSAFALCFATTSSGTSGICSTSDPGVVQVVSSLNGDDVIQFFWDSNGSCTDVTKSTFSDYEPKQL